MHGGDLSAVRAVIAPSRARRQSGLQHPDVDTAPGAVAHRVLRGIGDAVLAGELVGDLFVDFRQLGHGGGKEDPATRFLRELAQDELGFLEVRPPGFGRAQANRVDRGFLALRQVQHFVVLDQAGGVVTVREHHDRLPSYFFRRARVLLLQFPERHVDGVIERGRAIHGRLPDGMFERVLVARERLRDAHLAVELDDLHGVVLAHAPDEANRGLLGRDQLFFHAVAGVEQDGERDWLLHPGEEGDRLLDPVFVDFEVVLLQAGDVFGVLGAVGDGHAERDELDAGAKGALLGRQRNREEARARGAERRDAPAHQRPAVRVRARTVTSGRDTLTWSFSGGISISGRRYVTAY